MIVLPSQFGGRFLYMEIALSKVEKMKIVIPDKCNSQEIIEGIIKWVERRGCTTEINPHIKQNKPEILDEEEQVRQLLSVQ